MPRLLVIALGLLILVWNFSLYGMSSHESLSNYLFNAGYAILFVVGGIFALKNSVLSKGDLRQSHFYFGLALFSFAIANLIWTGYNVFLHTPVPYPSLADVFYLLFYPLLTWGFFLYLKAHSYRFTAKLGLESFVIFGIIFLTLFTFLGPSEGSPLASTLAAAYIFLDALLLSQVAVAIRGSTGRISLRLVLLTLGLLFLAIADTAFTYRTNLGVYWNGDLADSLFALSGFFLALGVAGRAKIRAV